MIKTILLPSFVLVLLTGCLSTAEKQAIEQNNRRMINSIQYPATARLKYTLDRGADPNLKDQYGVPVLFRAVAAKRMEHLKMLLDHGADLHAVDQDGETVIYAAVATNDIKIVDTLIKKGVSVNVRNKIGKTPAMEAARLGYIDMLKFMIDKGADINAVDDNTASLAAYAASSDKNAMEMLKYLESKGIKIDLDNTSLYGSPFLRALFYNRVDTASRLLPKMQKLDANDRMKQIGKLAAYYAIAHNEIGLLNLLIKRNLELNYNEPLYYKIVNQLKVDGIYKLAARNDVIDKRYTPLMYACIFGRTAMVQLLIDSGANPLVENNEGRIAQDYAKDNATARLIEKKTKEYQSKYLGNKTKQKGLTIEQDKSVRRATIFGM